MTWVVPFLRLQLDENAAAPENKAQDPRDQEIRRKTDKNFGVRVSHQVPKHKRVKLFKNSLVHWQSSNQVDGQRIHADHPERQREAITQRRYIEGKTKERKHQESYTARGDYERRRPNSLDDRAGHGANPQTNESR